MTGTAWTSRREIKKVYKKRVVKIPTHRPIDRNALPVEVFSSQQQKFEAVAQQAGEMIDLGRAVLIGTRSVEKSEVLARCLTDAGIQFQLLNARHLEMEAEIVSKAGQSGRVTIATNMAGRGTDIKLDAEVRRAGGLHVILTEIHESQRIDWQLIGRGSRQGDPGSYQIFVSMDDEILTLGLGGLKAKRLSSQYANANPSSLRSMFDLFRKAQQQIERKHLTDRLIVLKSDVERQKLMFETGQDPYLNTVSG
jgi:preprotein translocase subunit SecA